MIYTSTDCEEWNPVKTEDVPDWVKAPDVVSRMVDGEACQLNMESPWFVARAVIDDIDEHLIAAARAKRIRRAERNIALLH